MKRVVQWLVRIGVISGMAFGFFMAGAIFYSTSTTNYHKVEAATTIAPVLERIGDCESGNGTKGSAHHIDPKTGQVLMRANKNGSIDVGKYQVNEYYWGKKASELGYDLTKEGDNKAMAEWIYLNKGTTDWSASQKCWYN